MCFFTEQHQNSSSFPLFSDKTFITDKNSLRNNNFAHLGKQETGLILKR